MHLCLLPLTRVHSWRIRFSTKQNISVGQLYLVRLGLVALSNDLIDAAFLIAPAIARQIKRNHAVYAQTDYPLLYLFVVN